MGLDAEIIAGLLLDFAPSDYLEECGLSEDTRKEWVAFLWSCRHTARGRRDIVEFSAEALYHATCKRHRTGMLASHGSLKVDLLTLRELVGMAKDDEFMGTSELRQQIAKDVARKRIKKAQAAERPVKHDWPAVGKLVADLLDAGKTERELSGIVKTRLGVPATTFRRWRRKAAVS